MPRMVDLIFDEIIRETETAVLLKFDDQEVWMPLSVIEYDEEYKTVTMPYWLMKERRLEAYEDE